MADDDGRWVVVDQDDDPRRLNRHADLREGYESRFVSKPTLRAVGIRVMYLFSQRLAES